VAPSSETPRRDGNAPDRDGTAVTPVPPPRPAGGEAYLVHIHPLGPEAAGPHPLGPKPAVIGRDSGCTIIDPDPSVSRRHAIVLLQSDGRFLLTDLGSTNGTFVNDARVESSILADGDHVRFGSSVYRFLIGGNR
jgi:two-component system cell cycle response regulator